MSHTTIEPYLEVMQQYGAFEVLSVKPNGDVAPGIKVAGTEFRSLVITEHNLAQQVADVAAQLAYWARLQAQAKRSWEILERKYRIWRGRTCHDMREKAADKKLTEKAVEDGYRRMPEYDSWQIELEKAEEAFNATGALLEGFRAKKDLLKAHVVRAHDNAAPRLSV